jgi:hypothetical protein
MESIQVSSDHLESENTMGERRKDALRLTMWVMKPFTVAAIQPYLEGCRPVYYCVGIDGRIEM